MFESIGRSIELVKTSWNILMENKKLLVFPVLSGLVMMVVILTFAIPLIFARIFTGLTNSVSVSFLVVLFSFYVASYAVVIFFNTALITCVNAHLNDKDMSVSEGLANASRHLPSILIWAIISATVGIILHIIERRAGILGRIATSFIGIAWSLATFFVVPILILENKGVVDSVKESVSLMKKTWGESIVGSGSIMLVFVAFGVVAFVGVLATLAFGNMIVFGSAVVLFLILVVILAVIAAAMQAFLLRLSIPMQGPGRSLQHSAGILSSRHLPQNLPGREISENPHTFHPWQIHTLFLLPTIFRPGPD